MRGIVPRRHDLQNAQAIVAVGHERECTARNHSDFHVVHLVHLLVGIENLIEPRSFGIFNVDDAQSAAARCDVSVGASDIDIARIGKRNFSSFDWLGMREIGHIEHFHAVTIDDECVAELHRDAARTVERWCAYGRGNFWLERILQVNYNQIFSSEDVRKISRDDDAPSSG